MSISFGGSRCHTDSNRLPAQAHRGDNTQHLQRHERQAAQSATQGRQGLAEMAPELLERIADTRNIRTAMDRVIENGGAPGPDGLDCAELSNSKKWELARAIESCLLDGLYKHRPVRQVRIKKVFGAGHRTIHIESQIDRTVARATLQVLQPLIDPQFLDNSFGFRPNRDRRHALRAALEQLQEQRRHWVIIDLKNAFDNVPVSRLLDIVGVMLPGISSEMTELIRRLISTERKRGIRQGNPLSPLMQNIYLHHLLDSPWSKELPDEPLLRTADDILVCCRTTERAHMALEKLKTILRLTGMRPNQEKSDIRDLKENGAEWLGYRIAERKGEPCVQIAESAWKALGNGLEEAHYKPGTPIRARQTLFGWLDQLGPCYKPEKVDALYSRVNRMAGELAFDELPDRDEVQLRWKSAYTRWNLLCSFYSPSGTSGGSACQCFSAPSVRRGDGASAGAPSLPFRNGQRLTIFTDGACDRLTKVGAWAAILETEDGEELDKSSDMIHRTTNNRAELTAVIKALLKVHPHQSVRIISDSQYVTLGISERLTRWKLQGWRTGSKKHKKPLKNVDLWLELDALLAGRDVVCEWVRGHSGHPQNEECDRMAAELIDKYWKRR